MNAYRDLILNGTLPGALSTLYFALFSVALFVFGFALFVSSGPSSRITCDAAISLKGIGKKYRIASSKSLRLRRS